MPGEEVGSSGSQKIAIPLQSDGSIRVLGRDAYQRVVREEAVAQTKPNRARLVIAVLALVIGGLSVWYSQVGTSAHDGATPSAHR